MAEYSAENYGALNLPFSPEAEQSVLGAVLLDSSCLDRVAELLPRPLIVLFGAAGERDAQKRPQMANAVVKYADFTFLTSDNPRGEDPYAIIEDVEPGLKASGKPYAVEVERRTALRKALDMLREGDVLALCGKGHEDYQVVDGVTLYLDEHRIVREWLDEKGL